MCSCALVLFGSSILVSCEKNELNSQELKNENSELITMNGGYQIPQEFINLHMDQDFIDVFILDTMLYSYIENLSIEENSPLYGDLNSTITNIESLESILDNHQIPGTSEIINILNLKIDKLSFFITKYPNLISLPNNEIENIIKWNYNKFVQENDNVTLATCYDNLLEARSRCYTDYLIDMGVTAAYTVAASAGTPFAMTATAAIGTAYSLAKYGVCRNRANKDYNKCLGN